MGFNMKKGWIITLIIGGVFVLLNPSITAFKEYLGINSYDGIQRKYNFLLCSVYEYDQNKYLGIGANFIQVKKVEKIEPPKDSTSIAPIVSGQKPIDPYLFKLHFQLKKDKLFKGSYRDFESIYSNNHSIDSLYNFLKTSRLTEKSKEEFYQEYFPSFQ
jgi:hypothetical protein